MEHTGRGTGSYYEGNPSNETPILKESKTRGNKKQDKDSANNDNVPTSPESSTPPTLATSRGSVGSRDIAKGVVRTHAGRLQYFLKSSKKWIPAVYHNDIRDVLIQESEALGDYDYPRARGLGEDDVTSFHPNQKTWGTERQNWPDVLFQIIPDRGPRRAADKIGSWYKDGKILLDQDDNPIKDFPDIPTTLSSEFEGQYMEAMCRLDSRIKQADFRARMPNMIVAKADEPAVPLFKINAISMRMSRFRDQAALISREKRAGSKSLEQNLRQLLPKSCFEENSTRNFGRLLTREEVATVKSVNKGKFEYRVRKAEEPAVAAGTTGSKRKRARAATEKDDDEQTSEIRTISPEFPIVKRSRHADMQEPGWPSLIDPALQMLTPWEPNYGNQNNDLKAQAVSRSWSPARGDSFAESENAYSTNPSNEFALPVSGSKIHTVSNMRNIGSNQGFPQLDVLTNRGDLITHEYGTSYENTSMMKTLAAQSQTKDTGRLTYDIQRQSHSYMVAPTQSSISQYQPQNRINSFVPHDTTLANDPFITTRSMDNIKSTGPWNQTVNGGWGLQEQSMSTEWNPAQDTYSEFDDTKLSHGNVPYNPKRILNPACHASGNDLPLKLGTGDDNRVVSGEEPPAADTDPNFSFTDYLNLTDSEDNDQKYVTIGGL